MLVITGIEVINHTKSTRHLPGCCGSLTSGTIGRMRKRPLGPVELKSPACEGRELAAVLAGHGPLDALDDGRDRTSIVLELSVSCDSAAPSRLLSPQREHWSFCASPPGSAYDAPLVPGASPRAAAALPELGGSAARRGRARGHSGAMLANLGGGEDDAHHPARCRSGIRLGADKLQHHLLD